MINFVFNDFPPRNFNETFPGKYTKKKEKGRRKKKKRRMDGREEGRKERKQERHLRTVSLSQCIL